MAGRTEERFELRTGVPVIGREGELGTVERLVVRPGSGEVTHLVVHHGALAHDDVVVPVDVVEEADERAVRVRLYASDWERLPVYRPEEFITPPDGWQAPGREPGERMVFRAPAAGVAASHQPARAGQAEPAAGGWPIEAGMPVICRDGRVGTVDLVLLDPTSRRATHFVVRQSDLLEKDTIVPTDWVREIRERRELLGTHYEVVLDVGREQLAQLPLYRPDEEITVDVVRTLWRFTPELKVEDLREVEVHTHDGVVTLRGHTRTVEGRARIEAVARGVPGVLEVRNLLHTYEEEEHAAEELARLVGGAREQSPHHS